MLPEKSKAHQNTFDVVVPDVKVVRGQPSVVVHQYPLINCCFNFFALILSVKNFTLKLNSKTIMNDICT